MNLHSLRVLSVLATVVIVGFENSIYGSDCKCSELHKIVKRTIRMFHVLCLGLEKVYHLQCAMPMGTEMASYKHKFSM